MKNNCYKKGLVIGIIVLFIAIAVAPCINANVSKASVENKLVKLSIELCGIGGSQEKIVQLTKKDTIELETIFDDMKIKLNNVNTNQETIEIFNEVVESLNKLGLLPKEISVKEAQLLISNQNSMYNNINRENENFDCFIVGKTSWTTFIKPGWGIPLSNLLPILFNGSIAFGEECWDWNGGSGDYYRKPASGWVWTNGSNGEITWNGDSLWGNLGTHYYTTNFGEIWYEYLFYKGVTGFTGIRIKRRLAGHIYYFGIASHVAIVTEFPGKNPPIEIHNSHIGEHSLLLFQSFLDQFPLLQKISTFFTI